MEREIKMTSHKDRNSASVHIWADGEIILTGMLMCYSHGVIECFGKDLGGDFFVSSTDEGIRKIKEILIDKTSELRANEALNRINEQISISVNKAALKMSLRMAAFRANLFTQHQNIWKK